MSRHSSHGRTWQHTRHRILDRDGHLCQVRLAGCTLIATEVDHVITKSRGGTDDDWNLRAACSWCNRSRGDAQRRVLRGSLGW